MAIEPLDLQTDRGVQSFARGTVLVPVALAEGLDADALEALARTVASRDGVEVYRVTRGLATSGVDLGSPSLRPVELPRVAVLSGEGTSSYAVGEIWHLLDYRFRIATTLLDVEDVGRADLDRYTHVVLPHGGYGLSERAADELLSWSRSGGVLIGVQGGARWLQDRIADHDDDNGGDEAEPMLDDEEPRAYADYQRERAAQLIGGTILGARFDPTHPLLYGYDDPEIALFRSDAAVLRSRENPYEVVGRYLDPPRLSGYISPENQIRLAGTPAVVAARTGRGLVVLMADNPNFRSIWFGTSKLFLNGLFLRDLIASTSPPRSWHREE